MPFLKFIAEELFLSVLGRPYIKRRTPDCYILSYRKCGRTWLRMMLAKALALYHGSAHQYIFDSAELIRRGYFRVPYIDFTHGDEVFRRDDRLLERYRNRKVALLVRDPRDVVVSYYFHRTRRAGESYRISDFIRHQEFGIDGIIYYMNRWYDMREKFSDFMILRYEDLKRETLENLKRLLAFIGYGDMKEETLREAIEYGSFDNMRRLSVTKLKNEKRLAPKNPEDPESYKVRKAKVGGYTELLNKEDILYVEERISRYLTPLFGYNRAETLDMLADDIQ